MGELTKNGDVTLKMGDSGTIVGSESEPLDRAASPSGSGVSGDSRSKWGDDDNYHLKKITDYKTYAKGLMDIALLSANANQLRHAIQLCYPFNLVMVTLLSLSIILQVIASSILLIERLTISSKDYAKVKK